MPRFAWVGVAVACLASVPMAPRPARAGTGPASLGVATSGYFVLDDGRLVFQVAEFDQGDTDLNSDGDTGDTVQYVWDAATGATSTVPGTGFRPVDGGGVLFLATESAGASDLNGDGDTTDRVAQVWDAATGTTTNVGLAGGEVVPLDGGGLAIHVPEFDQGGDLNGDGDTTDRVVHVWDPETGTARNLRRSWLPETIAALEGGGVAFFVDEEEHGGDLNGDGDRHDKVVHVWDPSEDSVRSLELATLPGRSFMALSDGRYAFLVSESAQGGDDLNGDGDAQDLVVHTWDRATKRTTNLRLASTIFLGLFAALDAGELAFHVMERDQGGDDRNGDGDALDKVAAVWDPTSGETTNLRLATERPSGAFTPLDGGRLAFLVSEKEHDGDRNGDGDTSDSVVHVWDPESGTRNLQLAGAGFAAVDGGGVAISVLEGAQHHRDLNGDGDTDDMVLHYWDPQTGRATNLGEPTGGSVSVGGGRVAYIRWERFEGTDLNGDGDSIDEVVSVWDRATGLSTNLGVGGGATNPAVLGGGRFAFVVSEASEGVDLNGDGDTTDGVLHVWPGDPLVPPAVNPSKTVPAPSPSAAHGSDPDLLPPTGDSGQTPSGYWMVDGDGSVYAFGDAAPLGDARPAPGATVVDLEPTPSGRGYWIVDSTGRISAFGDARTLGDAETAATHAGERVTSLSSTPTGHGYWLFTTHGRAQAFGDAQHLGDMAGTALNGPVLDSVPTPSGRGYYMVAADGGIFTFGDARFTGSMGGHRLNAAVQSVVPDGDGDGYWLVASDGGVFAFDAPFRGSMGSVPLNRPVTGMVRYGDGYLMVGEDGGIFNFSDKAFSGSLGDRPPAAGIVSVAANPGASSKPT